MYSGLTNMSNQLTLRIFLALLFPACCYGLALTGTPPVLVLFHCLTGAVFAPMIILTPDIV
jgi:hypothetical protein